jgi:hypothetical protein
MNWEDVIKSVAPTVASALLGPLGGVAVAAIGNVLGVDAPTQDKIAKVVESANLTPEQIGKLKELELEYQENERVRNFKYAELVFADRDSARKANVAGSTQLPLFWLSLVILAGTIGTEGYVLFHGYPKEVPDMVVGRVLGLMDSVAVMVLSYWYGTSSGSAQKTELLTQQGK